MFLKFDFTHHMTFSKLKLQIFYYMGKFWVSLLQDKYVLAVLVTFLPFQFVSVVVEAVIVNFLDVL
jgi:hypothetical protein